MNRNNNGCRWIYLMPVLYVISVYLFPIIFFYQSGGESAQAENVPYPMWPLVLPVIFGLVNLATVLIGGEKITRLQLLNCARIVKYALIPFFILGGLCIALAILLMFTPVVIMIFVGPVVAGILSVLGWLALAGGAPYSIAYIVRACKEKVHGRVLSVFACIFQFFFCMDVIFVIILACKDRGYRQKMQKGYGHLLC